MSAIPLGPSDNSEPHPGTPRMFLERFATPDGVLNYLARLGWSHGDQEIFTRARISDTPLDMQVDGGFVTADFDDRNLTIRQPRHLGRINVSTHHPVTKMSETHTRRQADIARPDNANLHVLLPLRRADD